MLDRTGGAPRAEAATFPGERVGAVGGTDRPMPLYTPAKEPVTYGRGTLWIVVGILVVLFVLFFGWVLFLR